VGYTDSLAITSMHMSSGTFKGTEDVSNGNFTALADGTIRGVTVNVIATDPRTVALYSETRMGQLSADGTTMTTLE